MGKFKLPHSGHNKHLCYLVNLCVQQHDPKMYRKLIKEPQYLCKLCGRVAKKATNLCKPVKL